MEDRNLIDRPDRARSSEGGFTLVELLLVVAIIGLASRLVLVNYAALVPESALDEATSTVVSVFDQARTEAELRAQPLAVEIDLDLERIRMILPPEMRLTRDSTQPEPWQLQWQDLDETVDLATVAMVGSPAVHEGRVEIPIDHHGFMADQVIVVRHRNENLDHLVWSVQFRGLLRGARIVKNFEGNPEFFQVTEEFAFQ